MGNHRRYTKEQLDQIYGIYDTEPDSSSSDRSSVLRFPVGYARVSSSLQENLGNLDRQVERLKRAIQLRYGPRQYFVIIKEYGLGLNMNRAGLKRLLRLVRQNVVSCVLVCYRDRLVRTGFGLIETLFNEHGTSISIVERTPEKSLEQELASDIMEILACYMGKYHKTRAIQAELRNPLFVQKHLDPIDKLIQKWVDRYSNHTFRHLISIYS